METHKKIQRMKEHAKLALGMMRQMFIKIVRYLHRPSDPANLAVTRMLFGFLMILDIPNERSLGAADIRWGDPRECRFPLFDFMKPLPLEWMCIAYFVMIIGALGMILGAFYCISCCLFLLPYWYIFLLDKSRWNNHSYLYGLLAFHLLCTGANRIWSIDGMYNKTIRNSHVPFWNYLLLRGQVFLVYFLAGLKKLDKDWIQGFPMKKLSYHWVFGALRVFMPANYIDYFVVHLGGLILDLTVGFFMILAPTRRIAFFFCAVFNLMNSQIFSIGMFPWVLLAMMPLFCAPDWPKIAAETVLPKTLSSKILYTDEVQVNDKCIYPTGTSETGGTDDKPEKSETKEETPKSKTSSGNTEIKSRNVWITFGLFMYFLVQIILPYSHSITKGYNTWTNGLYGYSWDMMVHNWKRVHTKITLVDKRTGAFYFLDPEAWTQHNRWTQHADMVKQFATCVQRRVREEYNMSDVEIYIDVWLSLNSRFTQRVYDPTVNLIEAEWSPFRQTTWVLPLLTELSDWRTKLEDLQERLVENSNYSDVVFVADFPGLSLINYIEEELSNVTLEVLKGNVVVQVNSQSRSTALKEGEKIELPSGEFHKVTPIKHRPACYMYSFVNKTYAILENAWKSSTGGKMNQANQIGAESQSASNIIGHRYNDFVKQMEIIEAREKMAFLERLGETTLHRYTEWKRSVALLWDALSSIVRGQPMRFENHTEHGVSLQCTA